jgi:hypothetical protein
VILLDLSQTLHAAIGVAAHQEEAVSFDEDFVRYLVLNILRANKVKFEQEFGKLIICCDGSNVWRKKYFPYYKANRTKGKEESLVDWDEIYKAFNTIREELKEHFPYPVIHVDGCEGDDVIAILCQNYPDEKIKILSSDKDFVQLQINPSVTQYSPTMKTDIINANPIRQLRKLVLKGDGSDGVPSVFCADNYLVMREKGQRSKPISEKMIDESLESLEAFLTKYDIHERYIRNKTLIDLSQIPAHCSETVLSEYQAQLQKPKKNVLSYLIQKKQRVLSERVHDFA